MKVIRGMIAEEMPAALRRQAVVALLGSRQAGNTPLAHAVGETLDAVYLDLEDEDERARLAEPALFLEGLEDRLFIRRCSTWTRTSLWRDTLIVVQIGKGLRA